MGDTERMTLKFRNAKGCIRRSHLATVKSGDSVLFCGCDTIDVAGQHGLRGLANVYHLIFRRSEPLRTLRLGLDSTRFPRSERAFRASSGAVYSEGKQACPQVRSKSRSPEVTFIRSRLRITGRSSRAEGMVVLTRPVHEFVDALGSAPMCSRICEERWGDCLAAKLFLEKIIDLLITGTNTQKMTICEHNAAKLFAHSP